MDSTEVDVDAAQKGFEDGVGAAEGLYKHTLTVVGGNPSDEWKTGYMMGFLEYFSRTREVILSSMSEEVAGTLQ